MANEITIPILPCRSIDEVMTFYRALGFEVTYQQTRPNTYACVKRGGIDLHFFSMREYEPEHSYSTCIVLVPEVDGLYQAFSEGLRAHYGKRLVAGIPRMTQPHTKADGGRGFNVVDPGGNWIRISQINAPDEAENDSAPDKAASNMLARAIRAAEFLADSKGDFPAAAKTLDAALNEDANAPAAQRVQALIARAGIAITLGDPPRARTLLVKMRQIPLPDEERGLLAEALERADDLEAMLA